MRLYVVDCACRAIFSSSSDWGELHEFPHRSRDGEVAAYETREEAEEAAAAIRDMEYGSILLNEDGTEAARVIVRAEVVAFEKAGE